MENKEKKICKLSILKWELTQRAFLNRTSTGSTKGVMGLLR